MASLLFLLAVFVPSVLVTYVLMRALGFGKPPTEEPDTTGTEVLHKKSRRLDSGSEEVRQRTRSLERLAAAEEELFRRGSE